MSQPDESDLALDGALSAERREQLVSALRALSPADRDVIVYRYLLDMSEAETAALLDRPKGTVKSRANRALAKLRTQMIVWIVVILAVVTAVVIPPVRNAVADVIDTILRFGGVEVSSSPAPSLLPTPSPIPSSVPADLRSARDRALFPVGVPAKLGVPSSVVLGDVDPVHGAPRVVTLFYRDGAVRVDEFDGHMSPTSPRRRRRLHGMGHRPRRVRRLVPGAACDRVIDRAGLERVETARTSGPTLVWEVGAVTYRLEGIAARDEAIAIAESVQ